MDRKTIRIYDTGAAGFARDWEDEQPAPVDLQDAIRTHFTDGPTLDIGCGSGRDTAWLAENGFDVTGIDASEGLLTEARRRHPGVRFEQDSLPALESLGSGVFVNLLCETVIMHLPAEEIAPAVSRLVTLLAPNGALYLSWRVTEGSDSRDKSGRLYAAFDASLVRDPLAGLEIALDERIVSASSERVVHRIVARRRAEFSRGIQ